MTGMSPSTFSPALPDDATPAEKMLDIIHALSSAFVAKNHDAISENIKELESQAKTIQDHIRKLEGLALEDALTGLLNRHGFFLELHKEISRSHRHPDRGLCLLLIDLDDFKSINDTLGHPAGDACLQLAATTLRAAVRESDSVARIGGDEFSIIMGDISSLDIIKRTTEIRTRLNGSFMPWEESAIHVHGSVGFSVYQDGDTEKTLIHRADRSLYQQKTFKERRGS